VTANFTIESSLVDPIDSQCDPSVPQPDTGFYNAISGSLTDPDPDDNDTCTGLPLAILTVIKSVSGGSALPSDFELTLTGADGTHDSGTIYFSGEQPSIQVGVVYTLSEAADQVLNYVDAGVACSDDANGSSVSHPVAINAGQSVTCTQTNRYVPPVIPIIPVPVNDKLALLLLALMMLATGWYFRPAVIRKI